MAAGPDMAALHIQQLLWQQQLLQQQSAYIQQQLQMYTSGSLPLPQQPALMPQQPLAMMPGTPVQPAATAWAQSQKLLYPQQLQQAQLAAQFSGGSWASGQLAAAPSWGAQQQPAAAAAAAGVALQQQLGVESQASGNPFA